MSNAQPTTPERPPLKDRVQGLLVEYGSIALWVYFVIFAVVLFSCALALRFGIKVHGLASSAGIWAGAYLATKLLQPLRIIATVAVTPAAAALIKRRKSESSTPQ